MYTIALQHFHPSESLGYFNRGEEFAILTLPAVPMEDNIVEHEGALWQVVEVVYRFKQPQVILGVIAYDHEPENTEHHS